MRVDPSRRTDLPAEEVANAVLYLLDQHGSAPADELLREASRILGFQRVGHLVQERMRAGLEILKRRGRVDQSGEIVAISRRGEWS